MSLSFSRLKTTAFEAYDRALALISPDDELSENPNLARLEMTLAAHVFQDQNCLALRNSLCAESNVELPWRLRVERWDDFSFDCRLQSPTTRTELENVVDTLVRYGLMDLGLNLIDSIPSIADLTDVEKTDLRVRTAAHKISSKSELLEKIEECFNRAKPCPYEAKIYLNVGQKNGLFHPRENLDVRSAVFTLHALGHLHEEFTNVVSAREASELFGDKSSF